MIWSCRWLYQQRRLLLRIQNRESITKTCKVGESQSQKSEEDKEVFVTTSSERKGTLPEQIGPSDLRGYQNTLQCNSTTDNSET